jgi:hypothetical protein
VSRNAARPSGARGPLFSVDFGVCVKLHAHKSASGCHHNTHDHRHVTTYYTAIIVLTPHAINKSHEKLQRVGAEGSVASLYFKLATNEKLRNMGIHSSYMNTGG